VGSSVFKTLNVAYLNGCLLIAAAFAFAVKSWLVFPAALALTLFGGVYSGELRVPAKAR
jgi:hypothetical protein